ncbi:ABC transporter permease [Kribbella sp.]|uniref:ABC transporter permease n=1 Tax=Kribbella sp. TaxID=1871183 RepID=UPI002D35CD33|nr:ABC transporter permease [Kribbella sp.]HZX07815.1 ABC transporter permease [Kribbella sp.]
MTTVSAQDGLAARSFSPRALAWRRFRAHRLAMAGLAVLLLLVLASALGPLLYRTDPNAVDPLLYRQPPGSGHPLGTDSAGRDVLARLLAGGRVSLTIGLVAASLATVIGVGLGVTAGYLRGRTEAALSRIAEVFQSFPTLIVIIVAAAFLGPNLWLLILSLGFMQWTQAFRLTRGLTLSLREQDSIEAVEGLGATPWRIVRKHLVPAVLPQAAVSFTLLTATVIMTEAALSFLGLGVPPPTATWGGMINEAQQLRILGSMPWMWAPPGIAIALTVMAVNFVGDGLRDAVDPRGSR